MAENLRARRYRNGDTIAHVKDGQQWYGLIIGAFTWYYNDSARNHCLYGRIYNGYAMLDSRNLCPSGWHIPTDAEWTKLEEFLGGDKVAGDKIKSSSGWTNNSNGSNSTGFNGRPGAARYNNGGFGYLGAEGYWWSSSLDGQYVWFRYLYQNNFNIFRGSNLPGYGLSVRCVKD